MGTRQVPAHAGAFVAVRAVNRLRAEDSAEPTVGAPVDALVSRGALDRAVLVRLAGLAEDLRSGDDGRFALEVARFKVSTGIRGVSLGHLGFGIQGKRHVLRHLNCLQRPKRVRI